MASITNSELKFFRAANGSDLSTNGGRMSAVALASGVVGTLFPNVDDTERTAGSTKYRKMFFKVDHNGPETLYTPRLYLDKNTAGDDRLAWFVGTQTDTQAAITGSERKYGCGTLNATVSAGGTTVTVLVEPGATGLFLNGDTVRITDKPTIGGVGNEEFLTVSGASQAGDVVTLTVSALVNGYSSSLARVSSVYSPGDLKPTTSSVVVTSGTGGAYNTTTAPLVLNDQSTIEQTWTATFTSATAFDISGNTLGAVGSGSTSGGASPTNPDFSLPYFTLSNLGFSGTFATGDTLVWTTHPASIAMWLRRIVPAGAAVVAVSTGTFGVDGGTA